MSSGNFARVGDIISLQRLRARPDVYRFHLPCSLRQLSKPWSPPADMTMSKLSPSVRADNTTKSCTSLCRRLNCEFRHTSRNYCCCDHVLRLSGNRQSSTHVREHTIHVVLDLLGPHIEDVLLCLRTLAAFPSLSDRQASVSSVLVNDSTRS